MIKKDHLFAARFVFCGASFRLDSNRRVLKSETLSGRGLDTEGVEEVLKVVASVFSPVLFVSKILHCLVLSVCPGSNRLIN